jgi:hypothetical protein
MKQGNAELLLFNKDILIPSNADSMEVSWWSKEKGFHNKKFPTKLNILREKLIQSTIHVRFFIFMPCPC